MGGSFASDRIEDYYVDPIEVGYGGLIDFNHGFIGREALVRRKEDQRRHKVTLVWHADCLGVMRGSLFGTGDPARYLAMPIMRPMYATFRCDAVVKDGRMIGISHRPCYTTNAQTFISLAVADMDAARIGETATINIDDALCINTLVSAPGSSALTPSRPRSVPLQGTYNF